MVRAYARAFTLSVMPGITAAAASVMTNMVGGWRGAHGPASQSFATFRIRHEAYASRMKPPPDPHYRLRDHQPRPVGCTTPAHTRSPPDRAGIDIAFATRPQRCVVPSRIDGQIEVPGRLSVRRGAPPPGRARRGPSRLPGGRRHRSGYPVPHCRPAAAPMPHRQRRAPGAGP